MKPLSRRSVTAGLAAAVTAIPAVGLSIGAKAQTDPLERIRLALKELEAAFATYYADATSLRVTFNEAKPADLATGWVACCMVLADRLNDPRVSRIAYDAERERLRRLR